MTIDSVHLRHGAAPAPAAAPARVISGPSGAQAPPALVRAGGVPSVDTVQLSIPAAPPPDVLEQVTAAARCVEELRRNDRELHFRPDEHSTRIVIEVRDLAGNVLKTIPPSKALDMLTAAPGGEGRWPA